MFDTTARKRMTLEAPEEITSADDDSSRCREPGCGGKMLDVLEEYACGKCGVTREKVVTSARVRNGMTATHAIDYAPNLVLGSFMGPKEQVWESVPSRRFSDHIDKEKFERLKSISEYSTPRYADTLSVLRMVERVSEKLNLPTAVMVESVSKATKLMEIRATRARELRENGGVRDPVWKVSTTRLDRRELNLAVISAFSIISACRDLAYSVVRMVDVLEAHTQIGRRVKRSSLISLALEASDVLPPRRTAKPSDFIAVILAQLRPILEEIVE